MFAQKPEEKFEEMCQSGEIDQLVDKRLEQELDKLRSAFNSPSNSDSEYSGPIAETKFKLSDEQTI